MRVRVGVEGVIEKTYIGEGSGTNREKIIYLFSITPPTLTLMPL